MSDEKSLSAAIEGQGMRIRELKTAKASKADIQVEVAKLLELKSQFKTLTGADYTNPTAPPPAPPAAKSKKDGAASTDSINASTTDAAAGPSKKALKKEEKKAKKAGGRGAADGAALPAAADSSLINSSSSATAEKAQQVVSSKKGKVLYTAQIASSSSSSSAIVAASANAENLKCLLFASLLGVDLSIASIEESLALAKEVPYLPALIDFDAGAKQPQKLIFGGNAICRYIKALTPLPTGFSSAQQGEVDELFLQVVGRSMDKEEFELLPLVRAAHTNNAAEAAAPDAKKEIQSSLAVVVQDLCALCKTIPSGNNSSLAPIVPLCFSSSSGSGIESSSIVQSMLCCVLYSSVKEAFVLLNDTQSSEALAEEEFKRFTGLADSVENSALFASASAILKNIPAKESSRGGGGAGVGVAGGKKETKGIEKDGKTGSGGRKGAVGAGKVFTNDDIVKPVLQGVDWESAGLISSLRIMFDAALGAAFPADKAGGAAIAGAGANVTRCANPAFGDFQCSNAMGICKNLRAAADPAYSGPTSPKDIADRIVAALPANPIIESVSTAPSGFINIKLSIATLTNSIGSIVQKGVRPPVMPQKRVLVDFSSPNIAKEMHVGHLRSTIIGDAVCRILEFCNYEVERINHVGDWGTQFGMLITYMQETVPNIHDIALKRSKEIEASGSASLSDESLAALPNISDLNGFYKASKKRFDEDEAFKEHSRQNVVNLQSGDPVCRAIWTLLCDVSRREFQHVYDILGVKLEERGESFYNPMIPGVIEELQDSGLLQEDVGMLILKLPHFTIPLILRKSDGGYGYDSTDMAALAHRLFEKRNDWLIYITDAGQGPHFYMCFDAAKAAGWVTDFRSSCATRNTFTTSTTTTTTPAATATSAQADPAKGRVKRSAGEVRMDHIGFGVVCGEDGKRFKTRSGETVRLIDLLNAARDRMRESLQQRAQEGKSALSPEDLEKAAAIIGYGAVKYFDLKNHPNTNYIFKYERMLDTKGDTAVYLLFAYARVASILRKAKEERGIDIEGQFAQAASLIHLDHPAERALAFEVLQLGDVVKSVLHDLLPNRLCEYLKELSVKLTDFVTKCHVLNAEDVCSTTSRLLLCEAARRVMAKCFDLLGIESLDRI